MPAYTPARRARQLIAAARDEGWAAAEQLAYAALHDERPTAILRDLAVVAAGALPVAATVTGQTPEQLLTSLLGGIGTLGTDPDA